MATIVSAKVGNVARQGRQAADEICDYLDDLYYQWATTATFSGKVQHGTANTAPTGDAIFYGSALTSYVQWDYSANKLQTVGKVDVDFAGSNTNSDFLWDASGNLLSLGADTDWCDLKVFGATTGRYWLGRSRAAA